MVVAVVVAVVVADVLVPVVVVVIAVVGAAVDAAEPVIVNLVVEPIVVQVLVVVAVAIPVAAPAPAFVARRFVESRSRYSSLPMYPQQELDLKDFSKCSPMSSRRSRVVDFSLVVGMLEICWNCTSSLAAPRHCTTLKIRLPACGPKQYSPLSL